MTNHTPNLTIGQHVVVIDPDVLDPDEAIMRVGDVMAIDHDGFGDYVLVGSPEYAGRYYVTDYSIEAR